MNSRDLKTNSIQELNQKCADIRRFLIESVSKTGGHIGPNLGVVELTVALHHVFETPKDKIVWDVGHQAYAHKILTGRKGQFQNLRQKGGISGFPKITESEHDCFGTGHSSTSISAGLGMVAARDLTGGDFNVISVIGDGALTGGMAFEALNQLGSLQKKMIIVLNDNKMSISMNVGSLAKYTHRITKTKHYQDVKTKINTLIQENNASLLHELKEDLKTLASPGIVFEKLGINYLGPVDGHDLSDLIENLKKAKAIDGPVIIHAITKKGKGYETAEANAPKFHGIGPFDVKNGELTKKSEFISYTEAFSQSLIELAKNDAKIVAITAAMPNGTGLDKFAAKFPDRFFDVGIAEQHAVTFAAGMARLGLKPVVAIYSTFMQRAFDQLIHDVALQNLPVVFALDRAGLVGEDGPTHHGSFDLSYLRIIPNLIIAAPKDENELRDLLYTALESNAPFAIRYPKGSGRKNIAKTDFSSKRKEKIEIGKAEILKKGEDVVLVGIGSAVELCEEASKELEKKHKIQAEALNARFIKPLDKKIIERIMEVKKAVILEENTKIGGLYSAIMEEIGQEELKIKNLALPDKFVEHGAVQVLKDDCKLSTDAVIKEVLTIL